MLDVVEQRRQTLVAVRRANLRVLHSIELIRSVIADGERLAAYPGISETGRYQAETGRQVLARLEAQRDRLELRLGRLLTRHGDGHDDRPVDLARPAARS